MIKLGYGIAERDEEYNKLDAVIIAGDVTDMGTKIAFGNRTPVEKTVAGYYRYNIPETVKIELENLPDANYSLEVVAENCYGMQSEPLTIS